MSIQEKITALTNAKNEIKTALTNKGIENASSHGYDDFANDILSITTKGGSTSFPSFTYSGSYLLDQSDNGDWEIKFTSSGTLKCSTFGKGDGVIDVFLVGGGGSGSFIPVFWPYEQTFWRGGGGGYTSTSQYQLTKDDISVIIGAGGAAGGSNGESSSFGTLTVNGGYGGHGNTNSCCGGSGGGYNESQISLGVGGSDGGNGNGGSGQGTTTRAFGESDGFIYSNGGGANFAASGRAENTGDGSYGNSSLAGRSGIVIIRNHRG